MIICSLFLGQDMESRKMEAWQSIAGRAILPT